MCTGTYHGSTYNVPVHNVRCNIVTMADLIPDEHLLAWRTLLNAQAALVRAIEDALSAAGLPPFSWYDVLWPLHRERRPMRMGELSDSVVAIGRTGLTRLVDRLEAAGMITREPAPGDRRGVQVRITKEGTQLLRRMWPVYAGVLRERFVAILSPDAALGLADTLGRLTSAAVVAP